MKRFCACLAVAVNALLLPGCNDVSKAPAPPPGPSPLTILTASPLPDGAVNQPYNIALAASGGTPAYSWSLAPQSSSLPPGLTLNSSGTISGTPTATTPPGSPVSVIAQVFDSGAAAQGRQQQTTKPLTISVNPVPIPLQIVTGGLPPGTVHAPYFAALVGNGGTTPYTWGLQNGSPPLPPGLTFTANGFIQGTPTQAANPTLLITLQDAKLTVINKSLTLTIGNPTPPTISTTSLPDGIFSLAYHQTLGVSGGIAPFTWGVIAGGLPNGLTLESSTGTITGTPAATGTFDFTVRITDAISQFDDQALRLVIAAPPPPSITTSSLPVGTQGVAYSAQVQATGGGQPLHFQPVGLPFGLTFNAPPNSSTATITGTPTSHGSQSVTFTVNDSTVPFNQTGTRTLPLTVNAALTIDTASPLLSATLGQSYSATLSASGGTGPGTYTWSIVGTPASPPPGLTLTAAGVLSGIPNTTGSFARSYAVRDGNAVTVTKLLTLNVNQALSIDTTSLPDGLAFQPYSFQLAASGGTGPGTYTWTVTDPAVPLPTGFSLEPNGLLHGTTIFPRSYQLGLTVTDQSSPAPQSKSTTLTLLICC